LNKHTLIILLSVIVSGCTFTAVNEIEPGKYYISSSGSVFNSREGLLENINTKAKKACDNKPYKLEGDQNAGMVISTATSIANTPTAVPTTMLALTAVCEAN